MLFYCYYIFQARIKRKCGLFVIPLLKTIQKLIILGSSFFANYRANKKQGASLLRSPLFLALAVEKLNSRYAKYRW
jgi:hypothetical protein